MTTCETGNSAGIFVRSTGSGRSMDTRNRSRVLVTVVTIAVVEFCRKPASAPRPLFKAVAFDLHVDEHAILFVASAKWDAAGAIVVRLPDALGQSIRSAAGRIGYPAGLHIPRPAPRHRTTLTLITVVLLVRAAFCGAEMRDSI